MYEQDYTLEDLKVGMTVSTEQITRIYDTYILLENTKLLGNGFASGKIIYIGKAQTQEMREAYYKSVKKYGDSPMVCIHPSEIVGRQLYEC